MALTFSYPTLSNPISKTELEANFSDIASKFGAIVSSDLASSANVTSTQLAAPYQEVWVTLRTDSAWPAAGTMVDWAPIPGSNGDSAWTISDIVWVCSDVGDGAGKFDIVSGSYSGGAWVTGSTIVNAATITANGGANLGDQGSALSGNSGTIAFTTAVQSIALVSDTQGVGVCSAGSLRVTCCLKRYLTVAP